MPAHSSPQAVMVLTSLAVAFTPEADRALQTWLNKYNPSNK